MHKLHFLLAVVGFAIPLVLSSTTIQHGNFLLVGNPAETVSLIFGNYASTAFAADLLWVFVVFCIWVVLESRRCRLRHSWVYIALAFLLGVSGPLPLFLYFRERARAAA